MTYAGWFTLNARAKKANPPLANQPAPAVETALKALDTYPPLHTVLAPPDRYTQESLRLHVTALTEVAKALTNHKPLAADRSTHSGMQEICRSLASIAKRQIDEINALQIPSL